MTTFLLIRHATHRLLDNVLTGRTEGVHLSSDGVLEAEELAERLAGLPIAAVYSSPLERAFGTAVPLARRLDIAVRVEPTLNEIDFGAWAGLKFDVLASDSHWRNWNSFRSGTHAPGGESMLQAQARVVGALGGLQAAHPDQVVAVVSHGDVIKAVLAYFLGMPLDLLLRLAISPASCSVLALHSWGPEILCVNQRGPIRI